MKLLGSIDVSLLLLDDGRRDALSVGECDPMRQRLHPVQRLIQLLQVEEVIHINPCPSV